MKHIVLWLKALVAHIDRWAGVESELPPHLVGTTMPEPRDMSWHEAIPASWTDFVRMEYVPVELAKHIAALLGNEDFQKETGCESLARLVSLIESGGLNSDQISWAIKAYGEFCVACISLIAHDQVSTAEEPFADFVNTLDLSGFSGNQDEE